MIRLVLFLLALTFSSLIPAKAQFADQATYAGVGGGTNAQTLTLANASSYADLLGVIVKYVPGGANNGAATIAVSGNSGVLSGGPIAFRRATDAGLAPLVGGEIVVGQPISFMYNGTYAVIMNPTNTNLSVGSTNLLPSAQGFNSPLNLSLSASVSTNALTISVKGIDGNNASATNPIPIAFRDSTIANGGPKIVPLTSALSFTIASGSSMGCVSNQMCRIWVTVICASGLSCTGSAGTDTLALCGFNALSGVNVAPINEAALQTSQSGTSGGNSAQAYYCSSSAVTARAIRILGYVEIKETSAGTWATGPTYVQLFGPGIKKPGDPVQVLSSYPTTQGTVGSSTFVVLTNSPAQAITPTSEANPIKVFCTGTLDSGALQTNLQLSRGSTLIGNPFELVIASSSGWTIPVTMSATDLPGVTTSVTYQVQGKATTSTTFRFPFAGTGASIEIMEIMGAAEPANDNGDLAPRMFG